MKKILFLIVVLFLAVCAYAGPIQQKHKSVIAASTGESGSCTEVLSIGESDDDNNNFARTASNDEYVAGQFTWSPATNTDLRKIQLKLIEVTGDVSGHTYTIQIYNDSGDDPSTKVANASCTFSGSLISGTAAYVGCTTASAFTLTNGNDYHAGISRAGSVDGSNFSAYRNDADAGDGDLNKSSDESTWGAVDFSATITLKIFEGSACSGN